MASDPAIDARAVSRRYGSLLALDRLTFTVHAGEIVGVLGPNGAGKTTAIRVLTTILAPTRGEYRVAGTAHTRPVEIRRRIGVLPESNGYPDRQTGEEHLRYHARLFGHSRAEAAAIATARLAEVGLDERARSPIAAYSRGMRQRLGIARALVNDPRVIFLDEPTLGLDPAGQRMVLEIVRRIARERQAAVLLSTHLLSEVEDTCSHVLILSRGRVIARGTVSEITRRAAAPRSGRLRVAPERAGDATAALAAAAAVERVEPDSAQPGVLTVRLAGAGEAGLNQAIRAVVEAGIPLLSCELEGARLSDAFLAITGEP